MSRNPNMDGRTAKFLVERGVSEFGGPPHRGRGGGGGGWGRGGGGGGGGRNYLDRDKPSFNWTMNRSKTIQRKPKANNFLTRVDESGDVIMDGEKPSHSRAFSGPPRGRGNKKWRNLNRGGGDHSGPNRSRHTFGPGWHKVLIFDGTKYAREFILTALTNASSTTFQPVAYTPMGTNVVFFVEDRHSAEALAECSGRITGPDASKIEFKVESYPSPPTANIDDTCTEKLKIALTRRFNPTPPSLSLSSFHSSPDLLMDYYLPLIRPSVVDKIFTILDTTLPTLVYIDLSNNKLTSLDNFRKLGRLCPTLRGLDLRKNRLRDVSHLERLEGLELQELMLEGNPLCDKLSDRQRYVSAVRKYFPKVIELDGVQAPPVISFDLEEPTRIPIRKPSFFCNEFAQKVVLAFVEQYMLIYDSDDRQPLLEAYQDNAVMSMHCSYLKHNVSTDNPVNKLSMYFADSRNLVRQSDKFRRTRLVHEGKVDIVNFLNRMPRTTHDLNSFVLDMPLAVDAFISFTLSGVFKERSGRNSSLRAFQRTFIIVPQNSGFCIVNELLYVTNANPTQSKSAFKLPAAAPTPSTSPVPYVQQVSAPGISATSSSVSSLTEADKRTQMTALFAQESGMNEEWSRKCLEENGWDYQKSAHVFTELHKVGHIPAEAFVKSA